MSLKSNSFFLNKISAPYIAKLKFTWRNIAQNEYIANIKGANFRRTNLKKEQFHIRICQKREGKEREKLFILECVYLGLNTKPVNFSLLD